MKAMSAEEIAGTIRNCYGSARNVLEIKDDIEGEAELFNRYYGTKWCVVNPKPGVIGVMLGGDDILFVEETDNGLSFHKWGDNGVEEI